MRMWPLTVAERRVRRTTAWLAEIENPIIFVSGLRFVTAVDAEKTFDVGSNFVPDEGKLPKEGYELDGDGRLLRNTGLRWNKRLATGR